MAKAKRATKTVDIEPPTEAPPPKSAARAGKRQPTKHRHAASPAAAAVSVADVVDEPVPARLEVEPAQRKTPAGARAQAIHDRLVAKVREVETGFMGLASEIALAYQEKVWEFFRETDPEPYFRDQVGLQIRTVLRLKAIHEAVQRLPEGERAAAIAALGTLGRHKAAVLVPVIGNHEKSWQEWVAEAAATKTERALQAIVSTATGNERKSRNQPDYGALFMDRVVEGLHPKRQARVRAIWLAWNGLQGALIGQAQPFDPRSGLVELFEAGAVELGHHGIEITVE